MSVNDGLVGNIALSTRLLPTDDNGLLPSTLLIYDGFLCFCDELWPSLIAIFFVVIGHIVKDIVSIASFLRIHSFSHTRRQGNSIAHALAKRTRLSFPLLVWMKSIS